MNVLNFVPGLCNFMIANICKHEFKKKKNSEVEE